MNQHRMMAVVRYFLLLPIVLDRARKNEGIERYTERRICLFFRRDYVANISSLVCDVAFRRLFEVVKVANSHVAKRPGQGQDKMLGVDVFAISGINENV